jgi:hypothetical protein
MVAKYYILSRLKYCNSFYTDLAITSEDYKRIYEIAYPDVKEGENPAAKVLCPIQFISERDESSDAAMGDDKGEASLSDSILITAFIKADTEEQCNQILDVINSSFEKETQKLKGTDHGITCTYLDGGYISDQNNFYDNAEKMVVDRLDEVNKALNALDKKYADSFSKNQKEYFDALKVAEEKTAQGKANADSAGSHQKKKKASVLVPLVELLKYAGIGFLVGLVLILYLLIVIYALSGTVKSYKELGKYGIQTLDTSYFEKSSSPVFRFARFVRRITPSQIDRQLPMLAEDISIMMKREEVKRLYILMTTDDAMDVKVANTLKELIGKNGFQVASGNALEDIDELRILSESDRVVILAHMKKSMKHAITKAGAICERSDKKIYGFIAIEEC